MKKILLLNPPGKYNYTRDYYCSKVVKAGYCEHPVDFLFLSALLFKKYNFEILDAMVLKLGFQETRARILTCPYDVIIFLSGSASWQDDFCFLKAIKAQTNAIMVGLGDIFQEDCFFKDHIWIDAVILNFYSNDILKFLHGHTHGLKNMLIRGMETHNSAAFIPVLIPRHELFLKYNYSFPFARSLPFATVLTDFGCAFNCSFCIYGSLGHYCRSLESIMEELELIEGLGIREIFFKDQIFGGNPQRAIQLCHILSQKFKFSFTAFLRADRADVQLLTAMAAAGCHTIMFGVESGNPLVLRKYKQSLTKTEISKAFSRCRQFGIQTVGLFMLGFPEDDEDACKQTIDFAIELDCTYASFNIRVAKPGTTFYHSPHVNDQSGIVGPLTGLHRLQKTAIRKFYCRPIYLVRRLWQLHSIHELKTNLSILFILMKQYAGIA